MNENRPENNKSDSGIEQSFERVDCQYCQSKSSAFKTDFNRDGTIWQITCFQCGRIISGTPEGEREEQLRHKCRVRYVLG